MATVNINRSVTDMFYRYKMPKVIVKVEGKGNGIKTRIVNMSDIAKALDRPPSYPTKYFGCELGAQTTVDAKTDKYIVNGSHTADKMQDILDGFIQKFVLCPKCENPETVLNVLKSNISQRCMACGDRGVIKIVHRLTQFIQKNPPNAVAENGTSKKDKKKGKKGAKEDSDEEKTGNTEVIAQNYADADRNGDQDSPPPVVNDVEDEEWAEEATEDVGAIEQQLSSVTVSSSNSEQSHEEKLEFFYNLLERKKKEDAPIASQSKDLYLEAEKLDIVEKAPFVLTQILLTDNILKELVKFRTVFLRFCHGNERSQKSLLGSIEMLLCQSYPALLDKTAHILKGLYDTDLVEENILIDWHHRASKKYVGKEMRNKLANKAAPFIKWLEEAEEESGDESEEDDRPDVELEFSYQATSGMKEVKVKPAAKEEDDDFDIDDI